MNHLAHFHLSQGSHGWMIGGLLGDFVKGPLQGQYPDQWEQGIHLHRLIDTFSDQHNEWRNCYQLFQPKFRRFSGIMLDIAADHFLCRHWHRFEQTPLDDFCSTVYTLLEETTQLPDEARNLVHHLIRGQSLQRYHDRSSMGAALTRISQRLKRENPLHQAEQELLLNYQAVEQQFLSFYPQLQSFANTQREQLKKSANSESFSAVPFNAEQ